MNRHAVPEAKHDAARAAPAAKHDAARGTPARRATGRAAR